MSDVLPELSRPAPPPTLRDRLAGWAETLDLTPARLVGGAVVLAVVGFLGWRLLAPPPTPPEMRLPFVSTTGAADAAPNGSSEAVAAGGVGADDLGAGGVGATDAAGSSLPGADGAAVPSAATGGEVVVHVAGAVVRPGVEHLPAGARVVDAVEAAGGAAPDADQSRVNLAAPLEDGQQVYVPRLGELGGGAAPGAGGPGGGGTGDAAASGGDGAGPIVNLNTADVDQLDALPGIGPSIAQAVVDYREQNGPFATVDQLLDVRGIGEAKLADLRERVTV